MKDSSIGEGKRCVFGNFIFEAPGWCKVKFLKAFWVHSGGESTIFRLFRKVDFWQIVMVDRVSKDLDGELDRCREAMRIRKIYI